MSKEKENEEVEATEEEVEASAIEAMDEGIADASPLEDKDDDADDDAGTDEGDAEPEGKADPDKADEGTAGDEDAGEDADSDSDADSDEGDGDGDDDGEDDGAGDGKGAGDDDGGSDDAAGEPDHINDPIPEGTNEKTKERMTGLIDIAKAQTIRGDQGDDIVAAITGAGADPEQFTNTLSFLQLYNSADPEQRKQALTVARGVVHELSVDLGEGSVSLLDKHDDLKAEVEENTLTEARAIEIATQREQTALTTLRTNSTRTKEDEATATAALVTTGKAQLDTFEATVKADPAYEALYPTFRGILATTLRTTHPDEWGATAKSIYANLKAGYVPAAKKTVTKPGKQPLRAKQGAGGGGGDKEAEPASAEDAMSAAISEL